MLAEVDVMVEDEFGIGRKLKAGQPVPAKLVDAYNAATSGEVRQEDDDEPVKPQRHTKPPARRRK